MMSRVPANENPPLRVCLVIRQLNLGGAQRQLLALARGLDPERYRVTVLTFYAGGVFAAALKDLPRVHVHCLHKRGRWDLLGFLRRALLMLRHLRPDVLYSYLGGSNLLTIFCRPFLGKVRVLWGIRGSGLELHRYRWPERLTAWLEKLLSSLPDAILCNSRVGMEAAAALGFPREKLHFVPNGIDGEYFQPAYEAESLRKRWGINDEEIVLGLVARSDPMKDHDGCFRALRQLRQQGNPVRLVLVGYGPPDSEAQLRQKAANLGVAGWCVWEPAQDKMPDVYSAFDLLISSSAYGEGFPNVVAEAMACGTPCVVTDVGDSALLVGDLGEVISPRDPAALAEGILRMLVRLRMQPELRSMVRNRILERFSLAMMIEQTSVLLKSEQGPVEGKLR